MKSGLSSKKGTSRSSISSSEKICSIRCIIFSTVILALIAILAMSSFVITTLYNTSNNTKQDTQEEQYINQLKESITSTRHNSYLKDEEKDPKKQLGFIDSSLSNIYVKGEESFVKTIKSCIPPTLPMNNEKWQQKATCVERKKHSNKGTINRVGILAPPGKIGDAFYTLIKEVIEHIKSTTQLQEDIIIERETHVPPYGYGGNHGWTKVIRLLLPLKLSLGGISNEYTFNNNDKNTKMIATFRQIIRWHCRLSHFAAHTALITVNVTDFITIDDKSFDIIHTNFDHLLNNIISFIIGSSLSSSEIIIPIINSRETFNKSFINLKKAMMNTLQETNNFNDSIEFNTVLQNELDTTNQLSDWPCQSFLSFDHSNNKNDNGFYDPMTDMQVRNISKLLSPDCDNEHVKCTIDIDKCEVKAKSACS